MCRGFGEVEWISDGSVQFCDDGNRGFRNVGLLSIQPNDAAASMRIYCRKQRYILFQLYIYIYMKLKNIYCADTC